MMMEHHIKLMPSGHEFHAVEEETLLEAALRSGLNVDFSCSSGSCVDCRARLLRGELGQEDFHDHNFSVVEKAQGLFLLCTAHAAGDLVIEAGEAKSAKDIPRQKIKTKVSKIQEVSEHLRILQLRTPRTSPLRFLAGQHAALSMPGIGSLDSSIASCPCNGGQLQFHIPYEADNPFVEQLFSGLRLGSVIELGGPFGEMTLDDDSPRPLLMVAQDYELGPIKSMIEHAINLDLAQPVRLLWIAREGRHYMDNFCRSWGDALDDYRFVPLAYEPGESPEEQVVRAMAAIADEVTGLAKWDVYGAGSAPFTQSLQQGLLKAGAHEQRLFVPRRRTSKRLRHEVAAG
jgi:CDP-4-dehydro-6-deoxyglucose reductase